MKFDQLNIKTISSVFQTSDGRIFSGGAGTYERAQEHEMKLRFKDLRARVKSIGYKERDISDEYHEIFARRHNAKLITATPTNLAEYHDVLALIYLLHGSPVELEEAMELQPNFPMNLHVIVHRGSKNAHATVCAPEVAGSLHTDGIEIPLAPLNKTPADGTSAGKKHWYKNAPRSTAEAATMNGLAPQTVYARLRLGWEWLRAIETPVKVSAVS